MLTGEALDGLRDAIRDVRAAARSLASAADVAIAASEQGYRARDIAAVANPESDMLCLGCGLHQRSTLVMVALPERRYLCTDCIDLCASIVAEARAEWEPDPEPTEGDGAR